ncbi:MAG: hypothetical protein V4850_20455 [Myxococcota bacterium]
MGPLADALGEVLSYLRARDQHGSRHDGVVVLERRPVAADHVLLLGYVWEIDQHVSPLSVDVTIGHAAHSVIMRLGDPTRRWTAAEVERTWRKGRLTPDSIPWRWSYTFG